MREYVVDASVILKWILGDERESDQEKAIYLLNDWANGRSQLSAPTIWQYEVGNFLGRENPEKAGEKMELLLNLKIINVGLSHDICQKSFTWMKENGVTFYDASYLAAAYERGATLVTTDKAFVNKMSNMEHMCLLKDLDLAM
jgi:predicted nucleic acid-binding protein